MSNYGTGSNVNKVNAIVNESKLADRLGMKLTPGSGSRITSKGDLSSEKFLVESKQTNKASLSVKLDWLTKIQTESNDKHKFWAVYLGFTDIDNKVVNEGVLIPLSLFNKLRVALGDSFTEVD